MGFLVTLQKAGFLAQVVNALKSGANSVEFQRAYLEILDSFNPKKRSDFLSKLQEMYFQHADKFTHNAVLSMSNILALTLKADYALGTGTSEESNAILADLFNETRKLSAEDIASATAIVMTSQESALADANTHIPSIALFSEQGNAQKQEAVTAIPFTPEISEEFLLQVKRATQQNQESAQFIPEENVPVAFESLTEKQDELTIEEEVAKMQEADLEIARMAQQDRQDQAIQEQLDLIAYGNEVANKLQSLEETKKELDNSSAKVLDCSVDSARATAEKVAAFILTTEALIKSSNILGAIANAVVAFGDNYSRILKEVKEAK